MLSLSIVISLILSFFFVAAGIYFTVKGLFKRGIFLNAVGLLFTVIGVYLMALGYYEMFESDIVNIIQK